MVEKYQSKYFQLLGPCDRDICVCSVIVFILKWKYIIIIMRLAHKLVWLDIALWIYCKLCSHSFFFSGLDFTGCPVDHLYGGETGRNF